jgi:TRAP-type C4-dicarboxylate transport system permease small subunit
MRIHKTLISFDAVLSSIALAILLFTIIIQITLRFVFKSPLMGAEELTRYTLIWIVIAPLAFTERHDGHIIMLEFQNLLPGTLKKIIHFLCHLGTTAMYVFLTIATIRLVLGNMKNTTAELKIPFPLFFLPTILGFASISILRIITHIYHFRKKEPSWVLS